MAVLLARKNEAEDALFMLSTMASQYLKVLQATDGSLSYSYSYSHRLDRLYFNANAMHSTSMTLKKISW